MSIDQQSIVDNITRMGEPLDGDTTSRRRRVPRATESPPGLPYDVERARKLLAEAGYPGGKGFPRLPLLFNTDSPPRATSRRSSEDSGSENLGIDVELQGVELKIFGDALHNKDYAIARVAGIGDYLDASTFTDKYLSDSLQNDSDWSSTRVRRAAAPRPTTEPDAAQAPATCSSEAEHPARTKCRSSRCTTT